MVEKQTKPTIAELEARIGTPDELDILPDGSVQKKHKPRPIPEGSVQTQQEKRYSPITCVDFKESCFSLRSRIEDAKVLTMTVFREHPVFTDENYNPAAIHIENRGEMKANLMLAYRHLEDARMRLGKAIQAFDGGTSATQDSKRTVT